MNEATKPEGVLLFVDAIEDDEALVLLGERRWPMPRALLPPGAREGSWLRLSVDTSQRIGEEIEARRARLSRADPGGKIKL
jgi:hypothetical protein